MAAAPPSPGGGPLLYAKGAEINGSLHTAEACVPVNSAGWPVPPRLLYSVRGCRC